MNSIVDFVVLVVLLVILIVMIQFGYDFPWTGFGEYSISTGVEPAKTLWDWLDLLIVPFIIAVGTFFFNREENRRREKLEKEREKIETKRYNQEIEIADRRYQVDRDIAADKEKEERLQSFYGKMEELLFDRNLRNAENNSDAMHIARAITLTTLRGIDVQRKRFVLQFLYEAKLIDRENTIVQLWGADFRGGNFDDFYLVSANLAGADFTSSSFRGSTLEKAELRKARFKEVDFFEANLSGAILMGADFENANCLVANFIDSNLVEAYMRGARLDGARLNRADMRGTYLYSAVLQSAYLTDANLQGAYLGFANLFEAMVSDEQIRKADTLHKAILPDGTEVDEMKNSG